MKQQATALLLVICSIILVLSIAFTIQAAESTADVSVDAVKKEQLRKKILGNQQENNAMEEYVVGLRDILNVSVYGEGSMSADIGIQQETSSGETSDGTLGGGFIRGRGNGIEVRMDGRISLRHIGDVLVVGMTLTQIADYLKELFSVIYGNPSLTVTLVQSNSRQYTVMGQVMTPGLYHLDFPLNIVRAVARAGGFTEWANSKITVIRQKSDMNSDKRTFLFDFDDFLKGKKLEKNIVIKSGDVIVVH